MTLKFTLELQRSQGVRGAQVTGPRVEGERMHET